MNKEDRISVKKTVDEAADYKSEQAALEKACIIDMLPTIPDGAIDLFHQFDDRHSLLDYQAICKGLNLGFDRGARRYCFNGKKIKARVVYDKLSEAGFIVAARPGLLV
jgi:hypothetical protein